MYDTIEIARALTAQARRDSSLLLRLPSLDPARGGAVAESGDGDGWTCCCCCCFWRTQRGTARSREDGARGGRAGLLLTRARCEMTGLARQRRRGPARRERRRMEGTDGGWRPPGWHPSSPGPRVRSRSTTPAICVASQLATARVAAPATCSTLSRLPPPTVAHSCTGAP